jgi:HSP20 family molecular chaperone IbpA
MRTAKAAKTASKLIGDELKNDLADWMTADRDLVYRPAIALTKEEGVYAAKALLSVVDPKDVEVFIAPEAMMIKGVVHRAGEEPRKLLASIKFPKPVNPDKAHTEMYDGMISVRVELAEAAKSDHVMLLAA